MRKTGTVFVSLLLLLGLAFAVFAPADAQDDTDARLSALETRIAVIETALAGNMIVAPTSAATDGDIALTGVGVAVSEDFTLAPGRYQVTATWQTGIALAAHLWQPSGEKTLLFNELIVDGSSGGTATVIYTARDAGAYFVEVSNTDSPWTITVTPR